MEREGQEGEGRRREREPNAPATHPQAPAPAARPPSHPRRRTSPSPARPPRPRAREPRARPGPRPSSRARARRAPGCARRRGRSRPAGRARGRCRGGSPSRSLRAAWGGVSWAGRKGRGEGGGRGTDRRRGRCCPAGGTARGSRWRCRTKRGQCQSRSSAPTAEGVAKRRQLRGSRTSGTTHLACMCGALIVAPWLRTQYFRVSVSEQGSVPRSAGRQKPTGDGPEVARCVDIGVREVVDVVAPVDPLERVDDPASGDVHDELDSCRRGEGARERAHLGVERR